MSVAFNVDFGMRRQSKAYLPKEIENFVFRLRSIPHLHFAPCLHLLVRLDPMAFALSDAYENELGPHEVTAHAQYYYCRRVVGSFFRVFLTNLKQQDAFPI